MKRTGKYAKGSLHHIQRKIFSTQLILILTLALMLGFAGIWINLHFETQKRDRNLQNVSKTIADSPIFDGDAEGWGADVVVEYLDSLQQTLGDVDVISIVDTENKRLYHSNHELIGTAYDGALPDFEGGERTLYTENGNGPSGRQRRAYAAIYDDEGRYVGFVMTIMLRESITKETLQTMLIFLLITLVAVLIELIISAELSVNIKKRLLGYEPDVFSAMYRIRDDILESLAEGVVAVDGEGAVQFANAAALKLLECNEGTDIVGSPIGEICGAAIFAPTLESGEKELGIREAGLKNSNILLDRIPIKKDGKTVGAVGILHDREEYTRLMEDLAGTRHLVDSMRANNHDFTNKLHVILGLIQMEMYDEATDYIENITFVQRETVSKIMKAVREPAVAALLIGKTARASELNVSFILREGSSYGKDECPLPTEALITVIGNLIDNAFEAMNGNGELYGRPKELMLGIYSRDGALLITADDTGVGIAPEDIEKIYEHGYSTKGEGRGTGLWRVKAIVEGLGGSISVESQRGVGTSFSVSLARK